MNSRNVLAHAEHDHHPKAATRMTLLHLPVFSVEHTRHRRLAAPRMNPPYSVSRGATTIDKPIWHG
jgi:hypothetical protein